MVDMTTIGKGIGQFAIVALPALFMLVWTFDALLVPGADVFIVALIQIVFITVFIGYVNWKRGGD